jgi:hypothetical protein
MDPNEKRPVVPDPVPPPAPASTEGYTPEEEKEVQKRLEDLGYIYTLRVGSADDRTFAGRRSPRFPLSCWLQP